MRPQLFVDFDGTITSRDSIVFLTERFGAGAEFRLDVLDGITSGRMTVFEAIRREMQTVRASWEEAVAALQAEIRMDPHFPGFVDWCRRKELEVTVVSSGLRPVVDLFLNGLEVERYAHPVEITPDGWLYRHDPSLNKERLLGAAQSDGPIVYIGDGTSDVAAIPFTRRLYAKSYLAEYCRDRDLPFVPYETFADVRIDLQAWLS